MCFFCREKALENPGAHIWVYSEPGMGTTSKIYLPLVEQQPSVDLPEAPEKEVLPISGKILLLLDDNEVVPRALRSFLQAKGYRILEALDGNEGQEIAASYAGDLLNH